MKNEQMDEKIHSGMTVFTVIFIAFCMLIFVGNKAEGATVLVSPLSQSEAENPSEDLELAGSVYGETGRPETDEITLSGDGSTSGNYDQWRPNNSPDRATENTITVGLNDAENGQNGFTLDLGGTVDLDVEANNDTVNTAYIYAFSGNVPDDHNLTLEGMTLTLNGESNPLGTISVSGGNSENSVYEGIKVQFDDISPSDSLVFSTSVQFSYDSFGYDGIGDDQNLNIDFYNDPDLVVPEPSVISLSLVSLCLLRRKRY